MSSSKQRQLESFYERLNTYIAKGQNSKAVIVCDKILRAGDEEAKLKQVNKTKCVCLIRQRKVKNALEIAEQEGLEYEQAYCLYKQNKNEDALAILNGIVGLDEMGQNLKAQILYKIAKYGEAYDIYEKLVQVAEQEDRVSSELLANYIAASILSGHAHQSLDVVERHKNLSRANDAYELVYNQACNLLANRDPQAAIPKLDKAIDMGLDYLGMDDLLTQESIDAEISILKVQKGFALQSCNDDVLMDQAQMLYLDALSTKPQDISVASVVANNLLAIRGDFDLFESYKKIRANVTVESLEKLPDPYARTVWFNKALLLIQMQKSVECQALLDDLEKRFPDSHMPKLIRASLLLREKKQEKCVEYLQGLVQSAESENDATPFLLALAQLSITKGDYEEALNSLEKSQGSQQRPDLVQGIVSMYEHQGQLEKAEKYLESVCENTTGEERIQTALLHGNFLLRQEKYESAAKVFDTIIQNKYGQVDGDIRMQAFASFVIATSYFDPTASEAKAKALAMPPTVDEIDPVALESTFSLKQHRMAVQTQAISVVDKALMKSPSGSIDLVALQAKIKERKKAKNLKRRAKRREAYLADLQEKMGPDFDPAKQKVDPERWIPKNMREKALRARRKRGKWTGAQGAGDQSQGQYSKLDARETAKAQESAAAASSGKRKGKKKGRR